MVDYLLSLIAVICFCVCARQFIQAVIEPRSPFNLSGFSKAALQLRRAYSIFSWGVMTMTFLIALVVSFTQVYTQL